MSGEKMKTNILPGSTMTVDCSKSVREKVQDGMAKGMKSYERDALPMLSVVVFGFPCEVPGHRGPDGENIHVATVMWMHPDERVLSASIKTLEDTLVELKKRLT